jgi:hypothetical protein
MVMIDFARFIEVRTVVNPFNYVNTASEKTKLKKVGLVLGNYFL